MIATEVTEMGVGDGKGISVLSVLSVLSVFSVAKSYKKQIWFSIYIKYTGGGLNK